MQHWDNQRSSSASRSPEVLISLPAALAGATDKEVLKIAATALSNIYPGLGYIRVLLVSQNYSPSHLLELCADQRMASMLAAAHTTSGSASTSTSTSASTSASECHSSSQQAAMRQGLPVFTPQLQINTDAAGHQEYADWQLLHQHFGMNSFAAVPLMVAGTVHGVILAASAAPHTFNAESIHSLRTVAHMLSPYAAVLYKYQQIQSTRSLLGQLLPPRVVAAAIERLSAGGNSLVELFVPTHHDFRPHG